MNKFIRGLRGLTQITPGEIPKIRVIRVIRGLLLIFIINTCTTITNVDYAGLGKPADLVPFSSKVITGYLPNGLRYYIFENSLPENRAHAGLIVNAGSVLERDDQRGFAHFIEHLAFSDTMRFPDLQIQEYLRSLGMRFGPDFNANTSHERTLYYFDVPLETVNGVKRIPDRALAILDDWTHAVTFKPEFVESERRVILEEMRARSGAQERVRKILYPLLFAGSAYEDRDVIGLEKTIENATQEQLKEFYNSWYRSDNMAVVFIGDFDGKALEKELANHFNMPLAEQPVKRPAYELPPPKKGNFHAEIITDPEITSASFSIYYKQKHSAQKGTLAYYRETIIDYLISTMLNQRFEEAKQDPESSSTQSWGGPWYWASSSKFYIMGTTPKTGRAAQALDELMPEIESMRRGYGFTESELHRAKLNLVSYMEKQLSEKDRRESRSFLRGFTSVFLYGEDFADIEWEVEAVNALLPGIGLREIAQAAKNYFSYNDIIVTLTAPEAEKESLPSGEQIKRIFDNAKSLQITRRQDEVYSGELLDRLPPAGTITNEAIDEETGALSITLSNGARIILKETANKNNEIIMYAMAKGGVINMPEEASVSASLAAEMIQVSGLGPYSRTELVSRLAGKQISVSFWAYDFYRGFQGSSTTEDIKILFQMLHLFFTNPRLDERAINAMMDQYKTNLIHQEEDPQRYFSREATKLLTNYNPRLKPLELTDLEKMSVEQAYSFIKLCLNPGDYTFVFTGNINIDEMKKLCENYIASIGTNIQSMNEWVNFNITRPKEVKKNIYKGQDDRSIVYLVWFAKGFTGFNERKNQVSAVLSEYLDILLTDEIREKLGGVYGISANASVYIIPQSELTLSVYFVCNPDRVEELIAAVISSLQNIVSRPLNNDIFNQSKEALLMSHDRSMQRNLHIAQSYANSAVLYSTPLSRLNLRPDVIREVTVQEVQALCREVLAAGPVQVVLYPEARE